MKHHHFSLFYRSMLLLTHLSGGCGAVVTETGTDLQNSPPAALFPDDVDPVNAQLPFVATELLVRPFPGADAMQLEALFANVGAEVMAEPNGIGVIALAIDASALPAAAVALSENDLIESVHKNYVFQAQQIPNDPLYIQQPHLPQISAPAAWDLTTSHESILIAIVDTGVDVDHPDLADKIVDGWNVYDNNAQYGDVLGHGTQAAGCAAASSNNGLGVAGVAWGSRILAIRATDATGQSTSRHLAAGILWAVAQGADVINVSFAPLWSNAIVQAAATSAFHRGSLVVISAGNGGGLTTAAGYAEALFVGAVTTSDAIAAFSDRGPFVDIAAPGTAIRTTAMGGDYNLANGTSFAAPLVSGVAALAWSINPELPAFLIRDALTQSALDLGTRGKDGTFGDGRVDALAAVQAVQNAGDAADQTAPTVSFSAPRSNGVLTGRARISVTASDTKGVAQVALRLDNRPIATDTFVPFDFVLDTALHDAGAHELSVVATDSSGNASAPRSIAVQFSEGIAAASNGVTFRSPAEGAVVSGNVTISARVSANEGLATVEWFVDGESVFVSSISGTSSGVSYQWRTSAAARGAHTITLVAIDNRGIERSASLNLTVR